MAFHLVDINELYSNADGSIQFIELIIPANGENQWGGQTITVSQVGQPTHSFTFPGNLPFNTANKTVLVATQGFAVLGIVTPDFIIPDNFLFTTGSATVNFAGVSIVPYTSIPTNGTQSINASGVAGVNSPKNFAGVTGTVVPDSPPAVNITVDDQFVAAGQAFLLDLPANTFTEANGDVVTYTATLANDNPLPVWLLFDDATLIFSGTPGGGEVGTISVKLIAADEDGSAFDMFELAVISGQVINGTGAAELLTGGADDDRISALAGADTLAGGAGNDTMLGGADNDSYVVDGTGDVVTELPGQGTADLIRTSVTLPSLAANVENLTLDGVDNLDATGNSLGNVLTGNDGDNDFVGAGGADTMLGGNGNDSYTIDSTTDQVIEAAAGGDGDLVLTAITLPALAANVENLTLTGTSNVNATGNGLANALTGNSGSNVLDGGAGADTLAGGDGNDVYKVDDLGDVVAETGTGTDRVDSAVSFSLALAGAVENLTLTLSGAINGTGNALANRIVGNAGANILDGGAGNDTLTGGGGADAFRFTDAAGVDSITDFTSGTDQIQLDGAVFTSLADIMYDSDTGELFYDANGAAAGGLQLIAILQGCGGAPTLAAQDIVVI